jgi:uncharacterized protein
LMESPWAYSVMAVTILIDLYLLYIFFTKRSQKLWAPMTAGDRSRPPSRFPSDMTDDPFGSLSCPLGYGPGYCHAGIAISHAIHPLPVRFWPITDIGVCAGMSAFGGKADMSANVCF